MAVCYTEWKVLPHHPMEKLAENLWRLEGKMENGTRRVMSLARLQDGRILMHNPIALEDEEMAAIDAWGQVAAILVPNAFHRMDSRIMKARYPAAKVYCPADAAKAVTKAVPVDGSFADVPGDSTVTTRHMQGMRDREGVIEVRSADGVSQVYCDVVLNMPVMGGVFGFLLNPTGRLSVPRATRWFFTKDAGALKADLERLAAVDGLRRIIPGHGDMVVEDAPAKLRDAASLLG